MKKRAAILLIEELVNLPILRAAAKITTEQLSKLLDTAVDIGTAPKDINKLMRIFDKKTSYEKSPHPNLPSFRGETMPSRKAAEEFLSSLPKSSPFYLAPSMKVAKISVKSLVNKAPIDISKTKSPEDYFNKIWRFAQAENKKAGGQLKLPKRDRVLRLAYRKWENAFPEKHAEMKWAKEEAHLTKTVPDYVPGSRDKGRGNKSILQWQKEGSAKWRKDNTPKKPTMQKGGAYKGKKHNYSAGGKVTKLNF